MATLDATPKGLTANSYLTRAEADDYNSRTGNGAAWTALSDGEKDALLMWATLTIENNYTFRGYRCNFDQALQWPRTGLSFDGVSLDDDVIPARVKDATAEFARQLNTTDSTQEIRSTPISEIKLGEIGIKYQGASSQEVKVIPDIVANMLAPWIMDSAGGGSIRMMR